MRYKHTQTAPLSLILSAVGMAMLIAARQIPQPETGLVLFVIAGLVFLLALSFGQLTVRDDDDHLLIRFGPLPLFRRRIAYADMKNVERGRTTILDGWGVHLSPSGGWIWNLWGFDCVDVHFKKGRKLRIGTDDPKRLEAFLKGQIGDTA
jgi:hypothetical protein